MRVVLAGLILVVGTTPVLAQLSTYWGIRLPDPARSSIDRTTSALIADLSAVDYRTRVRAGQVLLAQGDRILPQLREALRQVDDPEGRRRLEVLVQKISTDRLVSPRRVTLRVKEQSAAAIIQELARQSGYPIPYSEPPSKNRYTFDLVDVPFWEALDKVCDAVGLMVMVQNEDGAISVTSHDTVNPFVAYSGPFRILPTNINTGRNLQLSGIPRAFPIPRQPEYIGVSFSLFSEPKAPIIGLGQTVVTKALDESGQSLVNDDIQTQNQTQSYYPPQIYGYRSFNQGLSVGLTRPNPRSTHIKDLSGTVSVLLLSEVRPEVTIDQLLTRKRTLFPGRTIDIEVLGSDYQNEILTLELTLKRRSGDQEDYNWVNWVTQRLEVTDAAGGRYQFNGIQEQTVGTNMVTVKAMFSPRNHPKKLGPPARLQYMEWVTVTREVAFSFKNLPMP